jgi:hypothetical protein
VGDTPAASSRSACDVARGREQRAVAIESHLADAAPPRLQQAAMPARHAAHRAVGQPGHQLRGAHARIELLLERRGPAVGGGALQK